MCRRSRLKLAIRKGRLESVSLGSRRGETRGLQGLQLLERSEESSLDVRFVSGKLGERVASGGGSSEHAPQDEESFLVLSVDAFLTPTPILLHVVTQADVETGLHLYDAAQSPRTARDAIHEEQLELADGLELFVKLFGKSTEEIAVITWEYRCLSEKPVLERVVADCVLPVLGPRAS